MQIISALVLSVIGLAPFTSANGKTKAIILYEREQITQPPRGSAVATSTTSSTSSSTTAAPNEFAEPINITLDGQIFPPAVQVESLNSTPYVEEHLHAFERSRKTDNHLRTMDSTIDCIDCSIIGNLSRSGGGEIALTDSEAPDDVKKFNSTFDFKDH